MRQSLAPQDSSMGVPLCGEIENLMDPLTS